MKGSKPAKKEKRPASSLWFLLAAALGGTLAVLFFRSFEPGQILFANDGPLGVVKAAENQMPDGFFGRWGGLNWIGGESTHPGPTINALFISVLTPELFLKVFAPFTLLFVGFCAWLFFRQLGFQPIVCVLGGLAAGLNMHFFSVACWGLGSWNIACGCVFLAMAALLAKSIRPVWAKALLAGFAVGMTVMEGFDSGAILSVYVGIFVLFWAWQQEGPLKARLIQGIWAEALVVFAAVFLATSTITLLIGTQISGIAGAQQDTETRLQRWDPATQWSIPKLETARVFIPGFFGYRMKAYVTDSDRSSSYWGTTGQDPLLKEMESSDPALRAQAGARAGAPPETVKALQNGDVSARAQIVDNFKSILRIRHCVYGEYAGILVLLLAMFAAANSWRGAASPFSQNERRAVWFWTGALVFSLLASWGRYGFIYRWIYALPYVSTIRNPMKFMHPFQVACLILAGYGLEALARRYMSNITNRAASVRPRWKDWWKNAPAFERYWAWGSVAGLALSIFGLAVLYAEKDALVQYLQTQKFEAKLAAGMASFCCRETIWFIVFLAASMAVLIGILSGAWTGQKSKWAWILLGTIMILDLGHADKPWINYFDYREKYSANPVTEFLKKTPWEYRVAAGRLVPTGGYFLAQDNDFTGICNFWLQNDFPYNNIQVIDIPQMPRMPVMEQKYLHVLDVTNNADWFPAARLWQLTNTRYILANAKMLPLLNQRADPTGHGFQLLSRLTIGLKEAAGHFEDWGDLTVAATKDGPFAFIEYTNALPRAKLYNQWMTPADDDAALAALSSPKFDPAKTVLVAKETPVPSTAPSPNTDPGTVTITDYHSKDVKLQAEVKSPSVLLLNDRTSPIWNVWVDQKPEAVLRCNYIMRGVFLTPGSHTIEFRFQPSLTTFYISLCAWASLLALVGYLVMTREKKAK